MERMRVCEIIIMYFRQSHKIAWPKCSNVQTIMLNKNDLIGFVCTTYPPSNRTGVDFGVVMTLEVGHAAEVHRGQRQGARSVVELFCWTCSDPVPYSKYFRHVHLAALSEWGSACETGHRSKLQAVAPLSKCQNGLQAGTPDLQALSK